VCFICKYNILLKQIHGLLIGFFAINGTIASVFLGNLLSNKRHFVLLASIGILSKLCTQSTFLNRDIVVLNLSFICLYIDWIPRQ
jgi:fluoride ion exporter CrcB/FEX